MRKSILSAFCLSLAFIALSGCSKTAATKSNFQKTLTTYYANNAHNPSCDAIIVGDNFSAPGSKTQQKYQALQEAGYLQFSKKVINQSIFGNSYAYSATLTPAGKAWVQNVKSVSNSPYANGNNKVDEASYCLGLLKVVSIDQIDELKEQEKWSGEKAAKVNFTYQVANIPTNLQNTLGAAFMKPLTAQATLSAKPDGWAVEKIRYQVAY